jgi:hypothetical protein
VTTLSNQPDPKYPASRLAGIKASTAGRKQATVDRLGTAIEELQAAKKPITVQTIREASGLDYTSYARNPDALALFRANSTYLTDRRKRRRRVSAPSASSPRDPLMSYKKSQLVARFRQAEHRIEELEIHNSQLVQQQVESDLKYAQLQAEVEEYRTFLQRFRADIQHKEHHEDNT